MGTSPNEDRMKDQVLAQLLALMEKGGQISPHLRADLTPPPPKAEIPKVSEFDSLVKDFLDSDPTKIADPAMDPQIAEYLGLTIPNTDPNQQFPFVWDQVAEYEGRMVEVFSPSHPNASGRDGRVRGVLTPNKRGTRTLGWEVHAIGGRMAGFNVDEPMFAVGVRTYKRIEDTSSVEKNGLVTGVKFNGGKRPVEVIEGMVLHPGRALIQVEDKRIEIDHSTDGPEFARWAIDDPNFKPPEKPTPRPQKEGRCHSCNEDAGKFECQCGPRPTTREASIGIVEVKTAGTRMTQYGECFDCDDSSDICRSCKECICCNEHATGCLNG